MGNYAVYADEQTLEEHIKSLADEELLDFWVETQSLARAFDQSNDPAMAGFGPEYERVIVQELQYRSSLRVQR